MQNYIHFNDRHYGLYFKYGRPFQNIGVGISFNDLIKYQNLEADMLIEGWKQDIFGNGASVEFSGTYKINHSLGLNFNIGYKTQGYLLGKQLNDGLILGLGISLYRNNKE